MECNKRLVVVNRNDNRGTSIFFGMMDNADELLDQTKQIGSEFWQWPRLDVPEY